MARHDPPDRRRLLQACDEVGPDDGLDPRDWAKDYSRRGPGRKTLQLCRQVAEALNVAFAGCRNEVLAGLVVTTVAPAPHAGRLLVTVTAAPSASERTASVVQGHLVRAAGMLRSAVAAAIHRRKTPELAIQVLSAPSP
jgi:ribosome-binding factor A